MEWFSICNGKIIKIFNETVKSIGYTDTARINASSGSISATATVSSNAVVICVISHLAWNNGHSGVSNLETLEWSRKNNTVTCTGIVSVVNTPDANYIFRILWYKK